MAIHIYRVVANSHMADALMVHVPRERTEEVVLATHEPTLEPGFVVLPALAGALVR